MNIRVKNISIKRLRESMNICYEATLKLLGVNKYYDVCSELNLWLRVFDSSDFLFVIRMINIANCRFQIDEKNV